MRTGRLAIIALLLACAAGVAAVLQRAWFESLGSFHSDAAIFITVARGWTKGLPPYSGLFENKTPAVFLLGALSVLTTGGTALLSWLQAGVVALTPLPLFLAGLRLRKEWTGRLLLLMTGCVIALYAAENGAQLLPESWGALFAMGFLALFATVIAKPAIGTIDIVSLSLLLLLATSAKEPFVVSTVGAALLLSRSLGALRLLAITVVSAGIGGSVALLLTGQFGGYVGIYLYHIFGSHLYNPWGTLGEPLWLRFNDVPRLWDSMWGFAPAFALSMAALWIGTLLLIAVKARPWKGPLALFVVGSFLNTAAVGITGDFYFHHFVCAVPLFAACALRLARDAEQTPPKTRRAFAAVLGVLLIAALAQAPRKYGDRLDAWTIWSEPRIAAAETLDAVMDRCGYARYLNLIDRPDGVYGFSRHLPYGPIFTHYGHFIGVMPEYLDALFTAFAEAPVAIARSDEEMIPMSPDTMAFIHESFTETPPACAGTFTQPLPYRILFRK